MILISREKINGAIFRSVFFRCTSLLGNFSANALAPETFAAVAQEVFGLLK